MNRIFKTIFNEHTGTWMAVSELARRTKSGGRVNGSTAGTHGDRPTLRWSPLAVGVLLALSGTAQADLPADGVFINGSDGTIEVDGSVLDVFADELGGEALGQDGAVTIDWEGGFNIGEDNTVRFNADGVGADAGVWVNIDEAGALSQIDGA
ncbi:ESPR domain-containing protein, partial [Thioalkalivibrio sp. ALE23]|uniref:ESPR domain-containing protein n=1 Tax=Thioalkalivibrio sp. ALE23 TaxID=1265495 RepID=UPI000570A587